MTPRASANPVTVRSIIRSPGHLIARDFELNLTAFDRQVRGAVHTPLETAEFIVVEAVAQWLSQRAGLAITDCRSGLLGTGMTRQVARAVLNLTPRLRLLDPAAGAGVFLRAAASVLAASITRASKVLWTSEPDYARPAVLLELCCKGFDLDAKAVRVANGVLRHEFEAADINERVELRDALRDGMADAQFAPDGWDIIVMNPPYIGAKFTKTRLGATIRRRLESSHGFSGDALAHFLVQAVASLTTGGVVGAIVSDTFFSAEGARPARELLLSKAHLATVAWCRPFKGVAVRGGILVLTRSGVGNRVWWTRSTNGDLALSRLAPAPRRSFEVLPSRSIFVPTEHARAAVKVWERVNNVSKAWDLANSRNVAAKQRALSELKVGDWTVIGIATVGGQGLATGDDREFVGYVDGTRGAEEARSRVTSIRDWIRSGGAGNRPLVELRRLEGAGATDEEALLSLNRLSAVSQDFHLPGRKPFRIVPRTLLRLTGLSDDERRGGISGAEAWVPYEMGDSSGRDRSGAAWLREPETAIDWSTTAVNTLRARVNDGPRRPFWRNESMWFREGVSHNRVTSYLRARLLPGSGIFSSESPAYFPIAEWLPTLALLALLNSTVVQYLVETFLASRNHVEVGHVRRVPVPVLSLSQAQQLQAMGLGAIACARVNGNIATIQREIDELVADLYIWRPPNVLLRRELARPPTRVKRDRSV